MRRSISGVILQAKRDAYTITSIWTITIEILVRSLHVVETKPTRACRKNSNLLVSCNSMFI